MNQDLAIDFSSAVRAVRDAGLMVSLCTIKAPPSTLTDAGGQKPLDQYEVVSGLQDIPCMDGPFLANPKFIAADEMIDPRDWTKILSTSRRHVLLDGYYSQFSPTTNWGDAGWIAILTNTVSGQVATYDIIGADNDSQATQTRLALRLVEV